GGGAQRIAQASPDEGAQSGGLEQMPAERGGGALSVGAGDSEDGLVDVAGRQLDLPEDGQALRARLDEDAQRGRHSGAHHHQVDASERLGRDGAHFAQAELLQHLAQLGGRLVIGGDDARAFERKQPRRGHPALAQPYHESALALELHLSFSEASAINESMIDAIQKRTMIFGSAQPSSSK